MKSPLQLMTELAHHYANNQWLIHSKAFDTATQIHMFHCDKTNRTLYAATDNPKALNEKYENEFEYIGYMPMTDAFDMRFQRVSPDFYIAKNAEDIPYEKLDSTEREVILNNAIRRAAKQCILRNHEAIKNLEGKKVYSIANDGALAKMKVLKQLVVDTKLRTLEPGGIIQLNLFRSLASLVLKVRVIFPYKQTTEQREETFTIADIKEGVLTDVQDKFELIDTYKLAEADNIFSVYNTLKEYNSLKSELYKVETQLYRYNKKVF